MLVHREWNDNQDLFELVSEELGLLGCGNEENFNYSVVSRAETSLYGNRGYIVIRQRNINTGETRRFQLTLMEEV